MALTDTAIRNAKAKDKPYKLGDSLGLFLLVQPSGGKLWRLKFRVDGVEKKLSLGTYPATTLNEARAGRDEARRKLATGADLLLKSNEPNSRLRSMQATHLSILPRSTSTNEREKGGLLQRSPRVNTI